MSPNVPYESALGTTSVRSKPILVLGGSGFIGTRLVRLLLDQKFQVRIGDLKPSDSFPDLWTHCDVQEVDSLRSTIQGSSMIINLAAEHRDDVRPLRRYYQTNVLGAQRVCQAAREANIQAIVFTSSVAVYGFPAQPIAEDGPFAPFNEYGKTKLEAENVYRGWAAEDSARSLVIVRPTVVFGEGNRGNVYNLLRQIASGRFLMVGSGQNVKSMAYVGNVAAFLAHALTLGPGEHIFNYVDQPDLRTKTLVEHIQRSLGMNGRLRSVPKPIALAAGYLLDLVARSSGRTFPISAIRIQKFCESTQFLAPRISQSGFVPPYSLHEGLDRTIQFDFSDRR